MYRKNRYVRLWPRGYKNYTLFTIAVCYNNTRNRTTILDRIGFFNPNLKERKMEANLQKLGHLMNKGILVKRNAAKAIGFLSDFPIKRK